MTDPKLSLIVFLVAFSAIVIAFALWAAFEDKTSKIRAILKAFSVIRGYLVYLGIVALVALIFNFIVKILRSN